TQARRRTISRTERVPRSGMKRRRGARSTVTVGAACIRASGAHADIRLAFAAKESRRAEDHDQQEQDKEKHLPISRSDVIAAERLHHADADPAEQRAFDAPHSAKHDDDEGDEHEIQSDRGKYGKEWHHHATGKADQSRTARK